ncbi:unnamed protein product [Echinostoma caproni]|uniref:Uncharacterized protein n=1 Tax=Echinostoma caproni TaxID=27848 RepID=A0A183AMN9_9TREM|nr:unnamed protein product [Echinostoma caproni]
MENDVRPGASEDVPACADHVAQLQEHQRIQNQPGRVATPPRVPPNAPVESDGHKESAPGTGRTRADMFPGSTNALFLDVGALAPRNAYCALCDTHEYLHRVDLPAYLISPCYHCREWLAREAKISPEILLDLHLRHSIPWPAFLQARFNLPPDGRSIEELISYDCRWRSRQPCRCLVSSGGPLLPPCVEFPWLCPPASTAAWDLGTGAPGTQSSQPPTSATLAPTESNTTDPVSPTTQPETPAAPSNEATSHAPPGEIKLSSNHENKPILGPVGCQTSETTIAASAAGSGSSSSRHTLPCAHRHPRGAPTTCCHGIQFPLIGVAGGSHCHQNQPAHHSPPASQPEMCPATAATTGHGAPVTGSVSGSQTGPLVTNGIA